MIGLLYNDRYIILHIKGLDCAVTHFDTIILYYLLHFNLIFCVKNIDILNRIILRPKTTVCPFQAYNFKRIEILVITNNININIWDISTRGLLILINNI